MEKKKRQCKQKIIAFIGFSSIAFIFLFIYYWPLLIFAFIQDELLWLVSAILILRILILAIMTFILFRKWLKQEAIYTSDAYFLFGATFVILLFAKILDLFWDLVFASGCFTDDYILLLLKIRYLVMILNVIPLLYLGLEVLITIINTYLKDMTTRQFKRVRQYIIILFLSSISFIIIIANETAILRKLLPVIVFGTMIGIVVMFLFMYKSKRLSQAHGLVIGVGFTLAVLSALVRSVITASNETFSLVIAEIIDMIVYFIIFIGFITKPGYAKEKANNGQL